MTDHNSAYKTPEAELIDNNQYDNDHPFCFYVVSRTKFCLLFITTMSLYMLYWDYENWRRLNREKNLGVWPLPRTFFNIFFTHSLYNHIDHELRERAIDWDWHPMLYATIFVIFELAYKFIDYAYSISIITNWIIYFLFTHVLFIIRMIPTLLAQQAINVCEGDPPGATNSKITPLNVVWMALGVLFWAYVYWDLIGFSFSNWLP